MTVTHLKDATQAPKVSAADWNAEHQVSGFAEEGHGHDTTHDHDADYAALSHGTHLTMAAIFDVMYPVGSLYASVVNTPPSLGTWVRWGEGRFWAGQKDGDADFDVAEEEGGAKTHTHVGHSGHLNHAVTQPGPHSDHTGVITHTHPVTDPGHTHTQASQTATTGGISSWEHGTIDTSSAAAETLPTGSATTGVTTQNPAGGVAALSHSAHSGAAVDAHSAHSAHDTPKNLPPYIVMYAWKRTA